MAEHGTPVELLNMDFSTTLYSSNDIDTAMDGYDADISTLNGQVSALETAISSLSSGTTSQYVRGNGSLATFPSIPAAQVQSDWAESNSSAVDFIKNKPTIPTILSRLFSTPAFSGTGGVTVATELSTSRDAQVGYAFDASVTISLLAGQSITATLQYADDSGMGTNLVTVDASETLNSGVLGLTQTNTLKLSGIIPAGKYRKVTFAVTGSATAPSTIKAGQEVLL